MASILSLAIKRIEKIPMLSKAVEKFERRVFLRHAIKVRAHAGKAMFEQSGGVIAGGLFAGTKITGLSAWGEDTYSVLVGEYERELHPVLRDKVDAKYSAFIDVGCSNGLYAVGFARLSPDTKVFASDISPMSRSLTLQNAVANGVSDRVEVLGALTHRSLDGIIGRFEKVLLLVDIEGAELDLVDPELCPGLLSCDIVIELHGDTAAAFSEFSRRFNDTHEMLSIDHRSRNPFEFGFLGVEFEDEAWVILSEGRKLAAVNWVYLRRRIN